MKMILTLVFISIGLINVFGQAKVLNESEFHAVYEKWSQQSKQKTYRIKTVGESQINGVSSGRSEESYSEYVPPDKRRFVTELKTPTLNIKVETIQIGEKKYTRKDLGEWKEVVIREKPLAKTNKKIIVESDQYKFIGQEVINGRNAEVFERTTKHKITSEKSASESFSTIKTKYLFSKDGLLLKIEMETEIVSGTTTSFSRRTSTYEYGPNIKIEAPIIKTELKQNPE